MKKIFAIALATVILMMGMSAFAADIVVNVNGEQLAFDQQPIMEGEHVLVPFRAVAEKLGANVTWFEDLQGEFPIQQVIAQHNDVVTVMQIGNHNIFVDGNAVSVEIAPVIAGGRTMVTLSAIESILGVGCNWDAENAIINIADEH